MTNPTAPKFTRTTVPGFGMENAKVAVLESAGFPAIEVHPMRSATGTRSYIVVRADDRNETIAEFRTQRDAKAYAVEAWEIDREG